MIAAPRSPFADVPDQVDAGADTLLSNEHVLASEERGRCCQFNANQSPNCETATLSGHQLTPLGQRD